MRFKTLRAFSLTVLAATAAAGCDNIRINAGTEGLGSCTPETTLMAATDTGKLITFKSTAPGIALTSVTVTGLGTAGIAGIDARPANGTIYILSTDDKLYTVNTTSGAATQVGAAPLAGFTNVGGFNFNPVPDRIRVINTDGSINKRFHPDTGALAGTDTALSYATGDVNAGKTFALRGMAYKAISMAGTPPASVTTAYVIDATQDVLATLGGPNGTPSPNGGQLFTVGTLGVDVSTASTQQTFEVDGANGVGYFVHEGSIRTLRQVNLTTGASKPCGSTATATGGADQPLKAMTVAL